MASMLRSRHLQAVVDYNIASKSTSIVLMAVVDSNYNFLYIDAGANGSCSDSGVFIGTGMYKVFKQARANLPSPQPLPNSQQPVLYHLG